jgi:hypothetical protein
MEHRKYLIGGLLVLSLAFFCANAAAQVIVTPDDTQGWFARASNTGTVELSAEQVRGAGTGSLKMSTDGSDGQVVKAARIPLITIDSITSISWDLYVDSSGSAATYPRPQLEYYSLSQNRSGTLVYDISNLSPGTDSWQSLSVDLNSDLFWSTEFGPGDTRTLAAWQTDLSGVLMNYFQLGMGSTSGPVPEVISYIDLVELNGTTWDFEGEAPLAPEPTATSVPTLSQWALIAMVGLLALFGFASLRNRSS